MGAKEKDCLLKSNINALHHSWCRKKGKRKAKEEEEEDNHDHLLQPRLY